LGNIRQVIRRRLQADERDTHMGYGYPALKAEAVSGKVFQVLVRSLCCLFSQLPTYTALPDLAACSSLSIFKE
jgi:hypothetical protein